MLETNTYDDPKNIPVAVRARWKFMESNSACAILKAVCSEEWADILDILTTYQLDPSTWLRPGGNRGDVPDQIDAFFSSRGWVEARIDLATRTTLIGRHGNKIGELPEIYQEGYLVDNFKGRVVLDVEWNAKDGNLDRDLAAYRSWFDAGVISAAVIITKDRLSLLKLARQLWKDYQDTLPLDERVKKLPIDLTTSTTTTFDKAELRLRRGVMGTCPVLIIGAGELTWNGKPFS